MTPEFNGSLTAGVPIQAIDTGLGWEYIRIINSSPYQLQVKMGGAGSFIHPEMFIEDIYVGQGSGYNGKIDITPTAVMSNTAQAPSFNLSVNAYAKGELQLPVTQPITILTNQGNQLVTIATEVVNSGNVAGANVVLGTPLNQATQLELNNDGSGFLAGGNITYATTGPFETYTADTTSTNAPFWKASSPRDGGYTWTAELLASPNHELALVYQDVGGTITIFKLTAGGLTLSPNSGTIQTDNFGNVSASSYKTIGGVQETGGCGATLSNQGAGAGVGIMANFKTVMTNTPSSITLSNIASSNASSIVANTISKTRFFLQWTVGIAGTSQALEDYTTVGN